MGDLLRQGPDPGQQRQKFFEKAFSLPPEERTFPRIMSIAAELGSTDPAERAQDFFKVEKSEQARMEGVASGVQIRKFLEQIPKFSPRFEPGLPSVQLSPEELTGLVSQAGNLPAETQEAFFESARSQDLGKRLPVVSPLEGFENLPPELTKSFGLQALNAALLKDPFQDISSVELEILAAQGNKLAEQVLSDRTEREIKVSAFRGFETERLKQGLPLTAEERSDLADPETLEAPPIGLTRSEALEKGFVKIRPQDRQKLADFGSSEILLKGLFDLADTLITAETAGDSIIQGTRLLTESLTRQNPAAAAYRDLRASFAGTLSRSLAAERGVLTDRDISRIVGAFPAFNDTVQVKEFKKGFINALFNRAFNETKAAVTGKPRDQKKWRKELDDLITTLTGKPIGRTEDGKTVIQLPSGERKVVD